MDDYVKIPSPGFKSKKKPAPVAKPVAPATVVKSTTPAPSPAPKKKFGVTTLSDYAEAMKRTNKDLEAFERANKPAASNNKNSKK